ncbi:N-acetyl-beta-hexosaminidase [Hahella sp. CCB-MM4]|uniref:family 20 glycosylhydrolase n=1 Tax=Hahella sp. (strain CCB-MM4) TaxID=1926491 RepID=UPI000B9AA76A|nr:family 20 glycosylhydrolase [Hahella sp. CCB-MM4]OZG75503.1 N-acetyl-beta-hexosaminidase [Hahella sp. CCB-MM4]
MIDWKETTRPKRLLLCLAMMGLAQAQVAAASASHSPLTGHAKNQQAYHSINKSIVQQSSNLAVTWQVVDNLQDSYNSFLADLTIENRGDEELAAGDWTIYFNFVRDILAVTPADQFSIQHINGDFFKMTPAAGFTGLKPGESVTVQIKASFWAISKSDAPAGFYIVQNGPSGDSDPMAITDVTLGDQVTLEQTSRFDGDNLPLDTAGVRFERNQQYLAAANTAGTILPTPAQMTVDKTAMLTVDGPIQLFFDHHFAREGKYLKNQLKALGIPVEVVSSCGKTANAICLQGEYASTNAGDSESYRLNSSAGAGVEISAATSAGMFYGVQSLLALIPVETYQGAGLPMQLPVVQIEDAPRFSYRGMHLDVARHFSQVDSVKRLIDVMALYKLNKLHLHLSDDEGWRLEIPSLPELTEVGGSRGHTSDELDHLVPSFGSGPYADSNNGSGYFSREEFISLLRYAAKHHIEVIPEFDLPGHARAAIKSMEFRAKRLADEGKPYQGKSFLLSDPQDQSQYKSVQGWTDNVVNPCMPSTYFFINQVVGEVFNMYLEAGQRMPAFHVGADEVPNGVWKNSQACEQMFGRDELTADDVEMLNRFFNSTVTGIVSAYGTKIAGWEELAFIHEDGSKVVNPNFVGGIMVPYVWNNVWGWGTEDNAYKLANAGYPVVLANATNLYFDLAYQKDPEEPGYYWAGFVDTRTVFEFTPMDLFKSAWTDRMGNPLNDSMWGSHTRLAADHADMIKGIQGELWSENVKTDGDLFYLALPKLLGLAERAWAPQPDWAVVEDQGQRLTDLNSAWSGFASRVGEYDLKRLDYWNNGYEFRVPLPGAKVEDGTLEANVAFPGLEIRYTLDGSEPDQSSALYTGPVAANGSVKLKAFTPSGRGSRTVEVN